MESLPLYNVILAYPPFDDWGEHRTLNIPLWRAVDGTGSVLVLVTEVENIYRGMACIKNWGFAYQSASFRAKALVLVGTVGKIQVPHLQGKDSLIKRLSVIGGNKLLLNPTQYQGKRKYAGWDIWSPYGWHQIDLYAYPARKNHVALDEGVLDSAQDLKRVFEDGREWRWRLGDAVVRLIHSQNVPRMQAYQWAHEAIGKQLSIQQIAAYTNLAEAVPPSQRDNSIQWGDYYNTVIRGSRREKQNAIK